MKQLYILFIATMLTASCGTVDVYEKTSPFSKHSWSSNDKLTFTFTITDTTTPYNLFAVIRHTDAYHFNNIWLHITTVSPDHTVNDQQVKLKLGDDQKGWLGSAMDDIIEHRILLNRYPVKLKKGQYTFTLQQIMREDPLQNVMNAGMRVEKANQ